MILTQNHGSDKLKEGIENRLEAVLRRKLRTAQLKVPPEILAKEIRENSYNFIQGDPIITKNILPETLKMAEEIMEESLCRMKTMSEDDPLDRMEQYTQMLIQELIEEEQEKKRKGEGGKSERELEKQIKEEEQEVERTRSEEKKASNPTEINEADEVVEKALKLLSKRSREKERKRERNKRISQIIQMNKSQVMFGEKLLLYKAIKKSLRVKVKAQKENKIYISIDNSGSMTSRRHKVKKFMSELAISGNEVMYTTWNECLNGDFKKFKKNYVFEPQGNDNVYRCALESIEKINEESVLVVVTDGTTYIGKNEFKHLIKQSEKKKIHFLLLSFGETENYEAPEGYEDRIIAYEKKTVNTESEDYDDDDEFFLDDDF